MPEEQGGKTRFCQPKTVEADGIPRDWRPPLRRIWLETRQLIQALHVPLLEQASWCQVQPEELWRYRDQEIISRGGMGIVYRVRDTSLNRISAMKVALPYVIRDPENVKRFETEACITAQLEHPNIVPVHDMGRTPDQSWFFTMKLVEGDPLNEIINAVREGNEEMSLRYDRHHRLVIFHKICDAVAYAHARGIIHRDIKPENVMVGAFGEVMLMDWGLAKNIGDERIEPPVFRRDNRGHVILTDRSGMTTQFGIVKGTPAYMAPEQALGQTAQVDRLTDIFLLGATLYHLATLRPPYGGKTAEEVLLHAERSEFLPPAEACPREQLPEELCRIIMKAMAPRKKDRYPTVQQLAADLNALMSGRGMGNRRVIGAGEFLMRAGEPGEEGYVILSGELEVFCGEGERRVKLGTLHTGDVVGEMAALTGEARSADVIASQVTEVEVITSKAIQEEMRRLPPWTGKVLNSLVGRLRQANQHVHPLLLGDCALAVARQLAFFCLLPECDGGASAWPVERLYQELGRHLAIPAARAEEAVRLLAAAGAVELLPADGICVLHRDQIAAVVQKLEAATTVPPPAG